MTDPTPPPGVDVSRPNVARMYDYWLGGTLNYPVDREAADRLSKLEPLTRQVAWANRGFLQRCATWIAKQGINQFLDFGAGLPTMNNTHDVVHEIDPDARVVYVDSDQEVCLHGQVLVANVDGVYYLRGDVRHVEKVLADPIVQRHIDFTRPLGLLAVGLLYFVADPYPPMRTLVDRLVPGSYAALSHVTGDHRDPNYVARGVKVYEQATEQMYPRTQAEVEQFFDGLDLVPPYKGADPGLSYVGQWGAEDPVEADDDANRWLYAGVATTPKRPG